MIWIKLKLNLKWLLRDIQERLGVSIKTESYKGRVRVLCFHGVCKDTQGYINGRFMKETSIKKLLIELKSNSNILTLEDYLNNNFSDEKLNLLLTFDDGYKNNKTLLLPILEELNIPATLFVLSRENKPIWTDLLDIIEAEQLDFSKVERDYNLKTKSNQEFKSWMKQQEVSIIQGVTDILFSIAEPILENYKDLWELLTNKELKELNNHHLISLANHTANHYNLINLSVIELEEEVKSCASNLKEMGSNYSKVLALPFGLYDKEVISHLTQIGYTTVFSTEDYSVELGSVRNRLVVNPFISIRNQIHSILDGKY